MVFLIVLSVLLLLLLLASLPLTVEARARIGLRGAIVRAKIRFLGWIPIPLRLRLNLFAPPYFSIRFGRKRIFLLRKKKKRGKLPKDGVRILRLDAKTTVGIEGEPAAAVLAAGAISVLLSTLIPTVAEDGAVRAGLSGSPMLRMSLRARAAIRPPELLFGILRDRRIARRKAANTIGKSSEKRTNDASG